MASNEHKNWRTLGLLQNLGDKAFEGLKWGMAEGRAKEDQALRRKAFEEKMRQFEATLPLERMRAETGKGRLGLQAEQFEANMPGGPQYEQKERLEKGRGRRTVAGAGKTIGAREAALAGNVPDLGAERKELEQRGFAEQKGRSQARKEFGPDPLEVQRFITERMGQMGKANFERMIQQELLKARLKGDESPAFIERAGQAVVPPGYNLQSREPPPPPQQSQPSNPVERATELREVIQTMNAREAISFLIEQGLPPEQAVQMAREAQLPPQ